MAIPPYTELEEKVKELIWESLQKRIAGLDQIDPMLDTDKLISRWQTAVMAIGFNAGDLNLAAMDIYQREKPSEGFSFFPYVFLNYIRKTKSSQSDQNRFIYKR